MQEGLLQRRQQRRDGRHPKGDFAHGQTFHVFDFLARPPYAFQRLACMTEHALTMLGQTHPFVGANQKRHSQLAFELFHRPAQR